MGSFERKLRERPRCGGMLVGLGLAVDLIPFSNRNHPPPTWRMRWTLLGRVPLRSRGTVRGRHGYHNFVFSAGTAPPGSLKGSRVTFLPYFRPSLWRVEALEHPAIT